MHAAGIACDVLLDQGRMDGTFGRRLSMIRGCEKPKDSSGIGDFTFWYNDRSVSGGNGSSHRIAACPAQPDQEY